jgi:hypothetical protein
MLQFLALFLFSAVIIVAVTAVVATVREELPYILRALAIDPAPLPPLRSTREPRVRVIRQGQLAMRARQRAVA